MPYIHLKASVSMDAEKKERVKTAFGKAITLMTGKTEEVLMVCIEPDADLWMGGIRLERGCYVAVEFFGPAASEDLDALNAVLFRILEEQLGAEKNAVYITYKQQEDWGARGSCIHWTRIQGK